MSKTQKQIIGDLGEGIVCNYLENKGFRVVDRNYWKPWGEIDIVAQKGDKLHFIEVKTVSRPVRERLSRITVFSNGAHEMFNKNIESVARETLFWVIRETVCGFWGRFSKIFSKKGDFFTGEVKRDEKQQQKDLRKIRDGRYRPEDNLHKWKLKRLTRVFQSYLMEKVSGETHWQFDIACVYLDVNNKVAKVEYTDDLIIQ